MRFLAFIGFLAIIGMAAAAGFFFGGYYNVAASVADPAIVATALEARARNYVYAFGRQLIIRATSG